MASVNSASEFCVFALTGTSRDDRCWDEVNCRARLGELRLCENCANTCREGEAEIDDDDVDDDEQQEFTQFYCQCSQVQGEPCSLLSGSLERLESCGLTEHRRIHLANSIKSSNDYTVPPPIAPSNNIEETIRIHSVNFTHQGPRTLGDDCRMLAKLSKETFWIGSKSRPRCRLEAAAQKIMNYHVNLHGLSSSTGSSGILGAEFWCQVKDTSSEDSIASGVDIHYDKDEYLAEVELGIFPTVSTVTYLEAPPNGACTAVFTNKIRDIEGDPIEGCVLSYPVVGKHLSFDGRYLHGAPSALTQPVMEALSKLQEGLKDGGDSGSSGSSCGSTRITFQVNVWVIEPKPQWLKPVWVK